MLGAINSLLPSLMQHSVKPESQPELAPEPAPAVQYHSDCNRCSSFESYESSYRSQENFALQVQTQDGDTVSIRFESVYATRQSQAFASNSNGYAYQAEYEMTAKDSFSYQIVGALSEAETGAIEALINDVSKVVDQFFAGDMRDALETGLALGFDTQQLAGFNLDLDRSEQASVVHTYREVAQYGGASQAVPKGLAVGLAQIEPLQNAIEQLLTQQQEHLANHQAKTKELVSGLIALDPRSRANDQQLLQALLSADNQQDR